jgi:Domain of unknown function (DUF4263)
MARFGGNAVDRLDLNVATGPEGQFQFIATPLRQPRISKTDASAKTHRHVLVERALSDGLVTTFPLNTLEGTERFFDPKYSQIRRISFTDASAGTVDNPFEEGPDASPFGPDTFDVFDFLDVLPAGFVKDPQFGLGLLKDCNRLVRLIEKHTACAEIRIEQLGSALKIDGDIFVIGLNAWDNIWSEIVRINGRGNVAASRVKDAFVHNELSSVLGIEKTTPVMGRLAMSKLLTRAANDEETLTDEEHRDLVDAMKVQAKAAAEAAPETMVALQRDIELVNLDRLIERFESDIEKNHDEEHWQRFFETNAFALQQVFGAPVVSVASGASVGGTKLDGSGNKIADYLVKNPLTANIALVEIKKPKTQIVKSRAYREGVFGISSELSEAVTQVLDQAHQLKLHFANVKSDSRQYDIEAYSIGCFVIAGRLPTPQEPDKLKSLELFRGNSSSVSIITFDEVLANLKILRDLLAVDSTHAPPPS